jgi:hypothetical protein
MVIWYLWVLACLTVVSFLGPALARIPSFDVTKLKMLEHKPNEASLVVLADKVLNARRQQQQLINRPGPEGLAHKQAESDSRKRRHQNPLFLGQAPRRSRHRGRP